MSDIQITDLTNTTESTFGSGTGIFDKLMQTVTLHVKQEYEDGRVSGSDYANVYLGSLQTVLQQSVQFLLQEQEAGKKADLIDSQILESEETIDLISAKTAGEYEGISSSQAKTVRDNLLNNKQVIKLQKEAILVERQVDKVTAETTDQTYITSFIRPQELLKVTADTDDQVFVTAFLRPEEVDLLQSRDAEQLAATTRTNNESTQKILLMVAQTEGFANDTKQKVLKQMYDGYAVNLSITGSGLVPLGSEKTAIDGLTDNILTSVGAADVIAGVAPS